MLKKSYLLASAVPTDRSRQACARLEGLAEDAGGVTLLSFPLQLEGCAQREAVQGGRCS